MFYTILYKKITQTLALFHHLQKTVRTISIQYENTGLLKICEATKKNLSNNAEYSKKILKVYKCCTKEKWSHLNTLTDTSVSGVHCKIDLRDFHNLLICLNIKYEYPWFVCLKYLAR